MVDVSASVNLPLQYKVQKLSSGTCSPGWSRKKGCKTVVVVWWWWCRFKYTKNITICIVETKRTLCTRLLQHAENCTLCKAALTHYNRNYYHNKAVRDNRLRYQVHDSVAQPGELQ